MVRWVKRLTTIGNIVFLFAFFLYGRTGIATVGGVVNLVWAFDERLPSSIRRFLRVWALMINTAFLAYGAFSGVPSTLALFLAGSSLLSWNAGLFLERWGDAPLTIQYQYLRQIGTLVALGLLAGLSAAALQGLLTLVFLPVLLLMLAAGVLCLRQISRAIKKERTG